MKEENGIVKLGLQLVVFGTFIGVSVGLGVYNYYRNYTRQKKHEIREFEFAIERFGEIIKIINMENKQSDFMISYFEQQFLNIHGALENLLPKEKSFSVTSLESKRKSSSELPELIRIYHQTRADYPSVPDLDKMSPQLIHHHCNLFEEYHRKRRVFCEYLAQKNFEELTKFQKLASIATEKVQLTK